MKICMLLHKSVVFDSRVRREAKALAAAGHDVTVAHLAPAEVPPAVTAEGYRVVSALPPRLGRRRLPLSLHRAAFMRRFVGIVRAMRPDAVHAHDAAMLAPGYVGSRLVGARLVYDSHELATGVAYRGVAWARFVRALERLFIRRCTAVITVSNGIAERLQALHGLSQKPVVVRNLPDLPVSNGRIDLCALLNLAPRTPIVLHQGAAATGRGCEVLVRSIAEVPGAHVLFLGDGDPGYSERLGRLAAEVDVAERVHFHPSVPLEELLSYTRGASVGVSLLEDRCENHRLALPNKVFEYLAAGIPVVASHLPELSKLVEPYGRGFTADPASPSDVARAIRSSLADTGQSSTSPVTPDDFSWIRESTRLTAIYDTPDEGQRRALILVRNAVTHDARVIRQARLLRRSGYDAMIVGVVAGDRHRDSTDPEGTTVRRLSPRSPLAWLRKGEVAEGGHNRSPESQRNTRPMQSGAASSSLRRLHRLLVTLDWYRQGVRLVLRERPSLVHCNDYNTMWIGIAAKLAGAKVVYDSHELWPDRNLRPEARWWLLLCESLFVRVADRVITTSPGYAEVMARRYRISAPVVVRNIPERAKLPVQARPTGRPTAVYFGALTRSRGLEQAIAALPRVPELRLRLVGPESWGFRGELECLIEAHGVADRVELCEPVAPSDASTVLGDAALGLALIQPACLSYELTLPNKLFEYLQAGLPILGTTLPIIAEFIDSHGIGMTVAPGHPESVASALRKMLEPETNMRFRQAAIAAASRVTWESERVRLADVYKSTVEPV